MLRTWGLASFVASVLGVLGVLAVGCGRLSEDELLEGKSCASDSDCVGGYVCDRAANLCVRGVAVPGENILTGAAGSDSTDGSGGSGSTGAGGTDGIPEGSGGDSGSAGASTWSAPDVCEDTCTGDRLCLGSQCVPRWLPIAAAPTELGARSKPAFAVGNGKLFVWGGVDGAGVDLSSGAIYDLAQDRWELTTITAETPSPRTLANVAWTGAGFLVWGGRLNSGESDYRSGAVYDPATGVWTPMPTAGNPRVASLLLSYDGQVLSWGGWNKAGAVLERSQRFNAGTNKWLSSTDDPLGKREHVAWATLGARLYILGGRSSTGTLLSDGFVYDMSTASWSSIQSLPAGRYGSFTAQDGSGLFSWGGRDLDAVHDDGLVMNGSLWTSINVEAGPSARWAPHHQSGWSCALAGERVAITGGHDVTGLPQLDGGVYSRIENTWSPLPASSEAHEWGVGACIDGTLVLWGGTHDGTASASGERITP